VIAAPPVFVGAVKLTEALPVLPLAEIPVGMPGAVSATVIVKVCTLVATPLFAVPPVSWAVTVTVALPVALPGVKVSVPLTAIAGWALKRALLVFVRVKLTVCADSSAGPAEMLVAKLLWLCAPAFGATVTT
jgi:hypothetical protein